MGEILWKSQYISPTEHNKYGRFPKKVDLEHIQKFIVTNQKKYRISKATIFSDGGFDFMPNVHMWQHKFIEEDPVTGLRKAKYKGNDGRIKYISIFFDWALINIYRSGTFDIYSWTEEKSYYQCKERQTPLKTSLKSMAECIVFVKDLWKYLE